jgi:hypothetical protein
MGATSTTGVSGSGDVRGLSNQQLTGLLQKGPSILLAGIASTEDSILSSPPTSSGTVEFDEVFQGPADGYIIVGTTLNGGSFYVTAKNEVNGNFSGFDFEASSACDIMYIITKPGRA